MRLNSFSFSGTAQQTVLNDFDGLSLTASCVTGANNGLTVNAFSGVPNAEISYNGISKSGGAPNGKATNDSVAISGTPTTILSPGGNVDTGNTSIGLGFTVGQIVYSNSAGNVVTVDYRFNASGATCQFDGTAVGRP